MTAAACATGGTLFAQNLTRVEGASLTSLDVRVLSENQPASPGSVLLQGIEILPIEMTGHTVNQELQADRTHITERNGFQRIELPGNGRLFRYRRGNGLQWGFLHVRENGSAAIAIELAGTGAAGTTDPFQDRLAVAADGRTAIAMLRAGGMHVVRLDGGVFASTGSATRFVSTPSTPIAPSMMVGRAFAFFETTQSNVDHLWRLPLADGGTPVDVTPPFGANDILRIEMAMSGDGSKVAFLLGPRNQWRIWLLGETGPARLLSPPPSKYEEPGYLPEGPGQPQLMLNQDGSRLFYLDSIISDETFLLDTTGVLPTVHITDDGIFQPTIGVHILPSFVANTFLVAIGNTINNVNVMDWFSVNLDAAGGTVVNLTGTGSMLTPFPVGTLNPVQGAVIGTKLLTTNLTGTTQTLRSINPATQTSTVLFNDLTAAPVAGSAIGVAPDVVATGAGSRLFNGTTGNLIGALPDGIFMTPPAKGPNYGVSWFHLPIPWGVVGLYLNDGTLLSTPLMTGVKQVVQTKTGAVVIEGANTRLLAPGVNTLLNVPATTIGATLSGAGG